MQKAVVSLLQQCTSYAEEIDKLLRLLLAAAWPQPPPLAASKDNPKMFF